MFNVDFRFKEIRRPHTHPLRSVSGDLAAQGIGSNRLNDRTDDGPPQDNQQEEQESQISGRVA
jgi:hypothetical protein